MQSLNKKSFLQKIKAGVALGLMVVFIAPSLSLGIAPKQASAQNVGGAAVSVASCLVANIVGMAIGAIQDILAVPVSNTAMTATAGNSWSMIVKECVLDTLVWALKEMIIQQLMQDVIGWIEGGFDGTPGFVTDPGGWLQDLSSTFVDEVLYNSGITDLVCTPFRADLTFALYLDTMTPRYDVGNGGGKAMCSLDDFLDGATFDVFVENGDFNAAGIPGMFGLTMDGNSPLGSFLSLQEDLGERLLDNVVGPTNQMLAYGDGYISMKCDVDGNPENGNESICTPGNFVQEQLNEHAKGPLKELIAADEFAEIVNALVSAFVTEVLNDEGGLLGRSSNQQYWDDARNNDTDTQSWCDRYPDEPLCGGVIVDPTEPVPPEVDPAQVAEWNALRSCLSGVVSTMLTIVSGWGDGRILEKTLILTQLYTLMSDISRVNTSQPEAGNELAAIQTRVDALSGATSVPVSCGSGSGSPILPPPDPIDPGLPPPPPPPALP